MNDEFDKRARPHIGRLLLGLGSFVLGLLFVPLPLPLGWLFLMIGISLIAVEIAWVGALARWFRLKWPWGDRRLRQLEPISPQMVKEFLHKTDPTGGAS